MKQGMQESDPAVMRLVTERARQREVARLDRIERYHELELEVRKKEDMANRL